jgi:hypothetical protein
LKEAKSSELVKAITSVEADLDRSYLTRLTSKLMEVWDTANVKISCIDAIRDGKKLRLIMITFDADTYDLSETTSSTKS